MRTMQQGILIVMALAGCLAAAGNLCAQTGAPQNAPGNSGQKPATAPPAQQANPFPDDTSKVPVMPTRDTAAGLPGAASDDDNARMLPLPSDSLDPVRSPDDGTPSTESRQELNSNSSSSDAGLDKILPSLEGSDQTQGKHKKLNAEEPQDQGMPPETPSEDIEVGKYYMDNKNWRAAMSRFESAMVLAPDEPEVYWGLAESARHLGDLAAARGYYQKVAEYDPDSKHGKEAIKILKEPEIANARAAAPASGQK